MIPVCYVYIVNPLQIARILPRIDEQEKPRTVPKLTNDHRACIEVLLCQSANPQKESNTFRLPRYRPSRDHLLKLLFSTGRGGEKGKDKKSRIICRRDSANQFPIKFTGHVRKMHPPAIEQADSSWRSALGIVEIVGSTERTKILRSSASDYYCSPWPFVYGARYTYCISTLCTCTHTHTHERAHTPTRTRISCIVPRDTYLLRFGYHAIRSANVTRATRRVITLFGYPIDPRNRTVNVACLFS